MYVPLYIPLSAAVSKLLAKPLAPVVVGFKKLVAEVAVVPSGAVPASMASKQPSPSESKSKWFTMLSPSVSLLHVAFGLPLGIVLVARLNVAFVTPP